MKITDPVIIIPWFDSEGMKQRTHLCFTGHVDHRRIVRELRRWAKMNFNANMSSEWAKAVLKANVTAFTTVIKPAMAIADRKVGLNQRIEDWIQRIQDDPEDEVESNTSSQGDLPETTKVGVSAVSEGSET